MNESDDVIAIHAARYRMVEEPALRRAESKVIGSDYGATSYTTTTQADHLADRLGLQAGGLLLDVGSGAGWPGIYLASSTGARVVLTDIPRDGLVVAARRMRRDAVAGSVVGAAGDALPFCDGVFDAVSSSDVLC